MGKWYRYVGCVMFFFCHTLFAESLFADDTYRALTTDRIASRPGDLITVLIYEAATASASADSDVNKASDVSVALTDGRNPIGGGANVSNEFNGGGSLNRAGRLVARVSATVQEVNENSDMLVRGEQTIAFNNEVQTIYVSGRVRPTDISSDNTVLSTRLANAEIKYVGEGLLSSREKPGIITRFFNWLF